MRREIRCIDNACVPCPDPYDCPGAVTPSHCNSTCVGPSMYKCDPDKHQCVADPSGTFSKKSDCELECS